MRHNSADRTTASGEAPERPEYGRLVPAVDQAARILFCLARNERAELSLTEICGEVGIHKSKGLAILRTLLDAALIVRDESSKEYALGPGLLYLSRAVLDKGDAGRFAKPYLAELVKATGATAFLGVINGEKVFVSAKEEPKEGIGLTIRVGHRYPLTWGAHGKAIAAFLPASERESVLAGPTYFHGGPGAALPPTDLQQELEGVRVLGYATDLGRMQPGIRAVAAPLLGAGDRPVGALVVVGTFPASAVPPIGERLAALSREVGALVGPTLERVFRKIA